MSVEANLARALELDDAYPDNVCPGCQQDITSWQQWEAHYPADVAVSLTQSWYRKVHGLPLPFVNEHTHKTVCPWTRDYLTARQFRRRYIAKYGQVAA